MLHDDAAFIQGGVFINISATSKTAVTKTDYFHTWLNTIQHVATNYHKVAKCMQHVVHNSVARCCIELLSAFSWDLRGPNALLTL